MSRIRRLWIVAALVVGMVGGGAAVASAAMPDAPAYFRLANLSPDTPAVDIYLASVGDPAEAFTVHGMGYGTVSDYGTLPATTYTVSMRAAGAPPDSPPMISTTFTAQSGGAYTLAGAGHYAELDFAVLDDDLAMPAAGQARVRVINAAATAPEVDLDVVDGPTLATGVEFAETSGYRSVPAGAWTVQVSAPGGASAQLPIRLDPGAVYSVLLVDRAGQLAADLHTDGVGSQTAPLGGVDTGYGGTSRKQAPVGLVVLVLAVVVGGAALFGLRARRRSTGRHAGRGGGDARPARPARMNGSVGRGILASLLAVAVLGATAITTGVTGSAGTRLEQQRPAAEPQPVAASGDLLMRPRPVPVAVRIPRLGMSSTLVPIGVDGTGVLQPPAATDVAGWYVGSAVPGDPGPAVIAGHVDSVAGPGAFFRLTALEPGDEVQVVRSDGHTTTFRVQSSGTFDKDEFPTASVYGPTPVAALALITCGGAFDERTQSYPANIIVHAASA